jgi:hypothetical protein
MWEGEQQIHLIVIGISEGWTFVFCKVTEVSWLTEQLVASQERPCYMETLRNLKATAG